MVFDLRMFSSTDKFASIKSKAYDAVVEHSHSFYELAYVISGKGMHTVNGATKPLAKGDIFFIGNDSKHFIVPVESSCMFEMINIIFDKDFTELPPEVIGENLSASVDENKLIEDAFVEVYSEYKRKDIHYTGIVKSLIDYSLLFLVRQNAMSSTDKKAPKLDPSSLDADDLFEFIKDYIQKNYRNIQSVGEVAKSWGIGLSKVQKFLRKERRTSLTEMIIHAKIKKACELLINTDMTVESIAEAVNFSDLKNFYMVFKRSLNQTPSQFRKERRGG